MYSKAYATIGKMVKQAREKAGITQAQLAKELGFTSPQYVSNLERGITNMSPESLGLICFILKMPDSEIIKMLSKEHLEELKKGFDAGRSSYLWNNPKKKAA